MQLIFCNTDGRMGSPFPNDGGQDFRPQKGTYLKGYPERVYLLPESHRDGDSGPLTRADVRGLSNCATPYSTLDFTLRHKVPDAG